MDKSFNQLLSHSLVAAISSITSQILFHPLELIKTRFQSHDGQQRNLVPKYKNLKSAINQIFQQEGFIGLYKGLFISIMAQTIARASFFGIYEVLKIKFQKKYNQEKSVFIASFLAGIITSFITQPLFVLKTNLLLDTEKNGQGYQNLKKHLFQINNDYGIKGFYRGFGISCILSIHGIIQLGIYEQLYNKMKVKNFNDRIIPFYSGLVSKFITMTFLFPLSTIKVRLQENQFCAIDEQLKLKKYPNQKYKNLFDLITKMTINEGFKSFYKGYKINICRQVPQQGIFFFLYDNLKKKYL